MSRQSKYVSKTRTIEKHIRNKQERYSTLAEKSRQKFEEKKKKQMQEYRKRQEEDKRKILEYEQLIESKKERTRRMEAIDVLNNQLLITLNIS